MSQKHPRRCAAALGPMFNQHVCKREMGHEGVHRCLCGETWGSPLLKVYVGGEALNGMKKSLEDLTKDEASQLLDKEAPK